MEGAIKKPPPVSSFGHYACGVVNVSPGAATIFPSAVNGFPSAVNVFTSAKNVFHVYNLFSFVSLKN